VTGCPRCHRQAQAAARFCAGCGAPLLLGEEVAEPLHQELDLDRRGGRRAAGPATAGAAVPVPVAAAHAAAPAPLPPSPHLGPALAAFERSQWELRPPATSPAAAPSGEDAALAAGAELPEPEVDALEVHVERAPAWRRATAWALDVAPFALGGGALARSLLREAGAGLVAQPSGLDGLLELLARERVIVLSVAAAVVLALAVYATLAHALAGATVGKRLLRLRVIGPDGRVPSPARSAARSALAVASAGALGLGFLLALFTRSGRALHDVIARTWVVKAP
jgi:resuscitation-promoting factor RpfA